MILFSGKDGSQSGAGYKKCAWGEDISLYYSTGETEYVFEDDKFVILVDTVIDKSKLGVFLEQVRQLVLDYECCRISSDLFAGAYFYIIIDKLSKKLTIARDRSGIKTGYLCSTENSFCIGNLVHAVADHCRVSSFNEDAIYQLLYLDYIMDGYTIYEEVDEIRIGQTIYFDGELQVSSSEDSDFKFSLEDNNLSFEDNVAKLRESIMLAHKKQVSGDNVIMLSGGIDSAIIAVALRDTQAGGSVRAVSYRVKGTDQDETPYAKEIADHLNIDHLIIEVDPLDDGRLREFENTILSMNNPYLGVWIYGQFDNPTPMKTYFAGQDTRLHTPDLNLIDRFTFALFRLRRFGVMKKVLAIIHAILLPARLLHIERLPSRYLRGFSRLLNCFDIETYVEKCFFKLDLSSIVAEGISPDKFETVREFFRIDYDKIRNVRQLYNEIVRRKWREQYTDDIRYLQDMTRLNNTFLALPFYDLDHAVYSSSIPFKQAARFMVGRKRFSNKRVLIRKYMLRSAFKDRLTERAFYRQKAVSNTFHLLFNGALGSKIRETITGDLGNQYSFIKDYRLEKFISRFLGNDNWRMDDDKYLLKIYHVAALCIYYKKIIGDNGQPSGDEEKSVGEKGVDSCRPD